ncbi:MAG TPA: hypothetical protein VF283_16150 [Bryobacteraceae bacterium]
MRRGWCAHNGAKNIRAVCSAVDIPVVGAREVGARHHTGLHHSDDCLRPAGGSCWRFDRRLGLHSAATTRNESIERIIGELKRKSQSLIMADVSTVDEGIAAAGMGIDLIATTLHGYTTGGNHDDRRPAFGLLRQLVHKVPVPVILDGRVRTPADLRKGVHWQSIGQVANIPGF